MREVGLAADLVALVREDLDDTSEHTIEELTIICVRNLLDRSTVAFFDHQQALLLLLKLVFLLLGSHFSLKGALNRGDSGSKGLTSTVNEIRESRNARLDNSSMSFRDLVIVVILVSKPLVVLHPLQDERFDTFKGGFLNRLECENQVDQITILLPHTSEVLSVTLILNPLKLRLEVQSVAHLIEKEGEEEVAPARLESHEARILVLVHIVDEGVAAGQRVSDWPEDRACEVQVGQEQGVVQLALHLFTMHRDVVVEVGTSVYRVDNIIDAKVSVVAVRVRQLHADDERVELEEVLRRREGVLWLVKIFIRVALADHGRLKVFFVVVVCDPVKLIFILFAQLVEGLLAVEDSALPSGGSFGRSKQTGGNDEH